ncbi:MAG: DUF6111 family protein [Sphingomonadales bacterium]
MAAVVLRVLLILLPLILYFVWRQYVSARSKAREEDDEAALNALQTRFMWTVAGLVVVFAAAAVTLALTSGTDPSGVYVAPHMEDGRLVPGDFRSPDS